MDEQSVQGKICGGHVGLGYSITVVCVNNGSKVGVQKKHETSESDINNIASNKGSKPGVNRGVDFANF